MQRRDSALINGGNAVNVSDVGDIGYVDHVEAVAIATPPRVEAIAGADG
jgi:hypothetical protein